MFFNNFHISVAKKYLCILSYLYIYKNVWFTPGVSTWKVYSYKGDTCLFAKILCFIVRL